MLHFRHQTLLVITLAVVALVLLIFRLRLKPNRSLDAMTTRQLLDLYKVPGGDDTAGLEFERRGKATRDELIRMLDTVPIDQADNENTRTIVKVLEFQFPSEESLHALERLRSRISEPRLQSELLTAATYLRAKLSGQFDAWLARRKSHSCRDDVLEHQELLLASALSTERHLLLPGVARAALRAGESENAASYAREILTSEARDGDGIYYANHVLGMLALQRGDIAEAKRYLIESARTTGSWLLNEGEQDTSLAEALLARGERDVVLEYLELSKSFWQKNDGLIDQWQQTIRNGGTPRFSQDRKQSSTR